MSSAAQFGVAVNSLVSDRVAVALAAVSTPAIAIAQLAFAIPSCAMSICPLPLRHSPAAVDEANFVLHCK